MPANPEAELAALHRELALLKAYPKEKLTEIIQDIRFTCTCCGRCCTRDFNDHVFLLSSDARDVVPEMRMPAPEFPYSDPKGNFYVSGYALRTKPDGSCVFLSDERRCMRYDRRFSICRIYPYMLHREPDERGHVDWRQISGLDKHGGYDAEISADTANAASDEVIAYETAYLAQEIAFHEAVLDRFSREGIRFVRRDHDRRTREFLRGGDAAAVYVWNGEELCREQAAPEDYR